MSKRRRRYFLKEREAKALLEETSKQLKIDLEKVYGSKPKVELIETGFGEIILINGKPSLFKVGQKFYPTLLFGEALTLMPKVVVDMGAIRHVCNGANVMAPGIIRFEGRFLKGDLVVVVDEKYGKPLVVGEVLYDDNEAAKVRQGVVVKNVHFVGDKIWESIKEIS